MRIEFYKLDTGEIVNGVHWLFVMDNFVFQDNFRTCESQCPCVGFEDFIEGRPDLGWRVVE